MSRTVRSLITIGIVSLLGLTACSSGEDTPAREETPAAPATLEEYYDQDISWQACEQVEDFECGTVAVPLDYDNPGDAQIDIHLTRAVETADNPPMLFNPGGPGSSGITFVQDQLSFVFSQRLLENVSTIGFDPRGVGASEPIRCQTGEEFDAARQVEIDVSTPEGWQAAVDENREYGEQCLERSGDIVKFADTISAAQDMDVIRAALGAEQLDYFGISYGTKLGATYAELFPDQVGKFVLDSVLTPDAEILEVTKSQSAGFERSFREWAQWCAQNTECNVGDQDDVDSVMQAVADFIADVEEAPLVYPDGRTQPVGDLFFGVVLPLYSQDNWPMLAAAFEQAIDGDYEQSDYTPLFLAFADSYHGRDQRGEYSNNTDAFNVINCLDYTGSDKTFEQVAQEAIEITDDAPLFGPYMAYGAGCTDWPIDAVDPIETIDAEGSEPIVVASLTSDPATPLHFSQQLAEDLDNSIHITVEGEGHGAYSPNNECIVDAIDQYLLEDTLPEDGLVCQ